MPMTTQRNEVLGASVGRNQKVAWAPRPVFPATGRGPMLLLAVADKPVTPGGSVMETIRTLWVIGLVVFWSFPAAAAEWQVGIARTEITPEKPVWMAGYAARNRPAEGTVHPLWAKVLVIEDGRGEQAVIVTTDVIGFVREVSDAIGARVHERIGIERERILLNSSHTHCGPEVLGCAAVAYDLDAEQLAAVTSYTRQLEDKIVMLIEQAYRAKRPARLAYGQGRATFAINRRQVRNKRYVISPNPEGPVDHVVPVLHVSDEDGKPLAVLFGYACHNTTLGGDFYRYCGDYAGFAQLEFEAKHPGVTAMFLIGCGADSNPNPRGTIELAEQHGKSLAAAVDETLEKELHPVRGPLTVAFERVDLPFVEPPTKEELEKCRGEGNVYQQRLTRVLLERIAEQGQLDRVYPCPVQVIRFGDDLSLLGLAGEVVVDYALRLRKEFQGERLWIAGYTNEVFAYVPSERVLAEGGYEAGGAMVYFGWHGPFQPGVENLLVGRIKKLLKRSK